MNPIKIIAETLIAGGSLLFPPLALAQPLLNTVLEKAPDSKHLKEIVKKLIDTNANLDDPKVAIAQNAIEFETEIKGYLCEVLEQVNQPTERINIMNAGIQEIFNSIVQANDINITTHSAGETKIEKAYVAGNNEVNIVTHSGGTTRITDSVVGKNEGMKTVVPQGWQVNQPSGWFQKFNSDGSFSIGTIGTPTGDFTIGTTGNAKGDFQIIQEKNKKE